MNRDPNTPLMQFFETVYKPMRLLQATAATVEQYVVAIQSFERFLQRPPTLADLTEEAVSGFMAAILADGRSPVTANMKASYLKTLARMAKRKRYIEHDLAEVEKLRAPKRLPTAWTAAEMEKIIQSCRQCGGRIGGVPARLWWVGFVLLAYDTGLRRRALLLVRFTDINFKSGLLRVPAENMKTAVEQVFKLHPQTIEALLATVPPDRELLFPHHQHLDSLYCRYKTILKRAELPYSGKDMFHKLRRTCASHIAAKGGEALAIKQLGHLDPSCIKRYVDPTLTASHDLAGLLPRPSWENPREVVVTHSDGPVYHMGQPLKIILPSDGLGHTGAIERIVAAGDNLDLADVRAAIAEMGLSEHSFAQEACLNAGHLNRVFNAKKPLTRDMERRIRSALGVGPRPRKVTDRDGMPKYQRLIVQPPPGTRPADHPLLNEEPFSLLPEFTAEVLSRYAEARRRRFLGWLRSVLTIDGALAVRDIQFESTFILICQQQEAGVIHDKTAEGMRAALRHFATWLVEQRSVYYFTRVLPRLNRHLSRAARKMLAQKAEEGKGAA